MFSCTMTRHPIIMKCYCTSPETEKKKKKKKKREREREREDIELISCEFFSMTNRKNSSFKRFLC